MTTRGVFTYFSDMPEKSHELFGFSKKQTSLFRHAETSTTNTGSNLLNYIDIFFMNTFWSAYCILQSNQSNVATTHTRIRHNEGRWNMKWIIGMSCLVGSLLLAATGSESAIFHAAGVSEILHRGDIMRLHQVPEPATMFLLGTGLIGLSAIIRKKMR